MQKAEYRIFSPDLPRKSGLEPLQNSGNHKNLALLLLEKRGSLSVFSIGYRLSVKSPKGNKKTNN